MQKDRKTVQMVRTLAAHERSKDGISNMGRVYRYKQTRGKGRPAMTWDQVINQILTVKGIIWTITG